MKQFRNLIITAILILFSIVNLSFAQSTVQDTAYNHSSEVFFPEMTPQLVDNLDLLGRVWGFLKYHHPVISKGAYNWDEELFKMLPYVVTIIVLIITSMRKKREHQPPQSLGLNHFREER